jgi:hypothetical protein
MLIQCFNTRDEHHEHVDQQTQPKSNYQSLTDLAALVIERSLAADDAKQHLIGLAVKNCSSIAQRIDN